MFYDKAAGKFRRESFLSYGFVNHETEASRTGAEIRFNVVVEPPPREFEGLRWRSFLRRLSNEEIATGFEVAKAAKTSGRTGRSDSAGPRELRGPRSYRRART